MDVTLAEEFAKVLATETSAPWLGNATNAELEAEMKCRREMGSTDPDYYTAMDRFSPSQPPRTTPEGGAGVRPGLRGC